MVGELGIIVGGGGLTGLMMRLCEVLSSNSKMIIIIIPYCSKIVRLKREITKRAYEDLPNSIHL